MICWRSLLWILRTYRSLLFEFLCFSFIYSLCKCLELKTSSDWYYISFILYPQASPNALSLLFGGFSWANFFYKQPLFFETLFSTVLSLLFSLSKSWSSLEHPLSKMALALYLFYATNYFCHTHITFILCWLFSLLICHFIELSGYGSVICAPPFDQ